MINFISSIGFGQDSIDDSENTTGAGSNANVIHFIMTCYNGLVVALIVMFMCITQNKVNKSMSARAFMENAPVLPIPSSDLPWMMGAAFLILVVCGYFYSRGNSIPRLWRYGLLLCEVIMCILLLRGLNLAYDGIVLLLVADIMYRCKGKEQLLVMLFSMIILYIIISYNVALLNMEVIPFSYYASYYKASVQSMLLSLQHIAVYGNIILFVMYMVILVQDKRRENEEIAQLNAQLQSTNMRLNESNNKLNIANNQMNSANRKLREYAMTVASLTETRERNRLAREIHDTLGHALTGIVAGVDACMVTIDIAPEATKKQLAKIREAAQHGITDVRRSMHKLRPDDLEKLSLKDALIKMANDFSDAGTTRVELKLDNFPTGLREDQSEVVYRILQEGMTNASRHGHAANVSIYVKGEDNQLNILIADDGIGCDNVKAGFGLHHMQERVSLIGGTLNFYSKNGFVLEVTLPLNKE